MGELSAGMCRECSRAMLPSTPADDTSNHPAIDLGGICWGCVAGMDDETREGHIMADDVLVAALTPPPGTHRPTLPKVGSVWRLDGREVEVTGADAQGVQWEHKAETFTPQGDPSSLLLHGATGLADFLDRAEFVQDGEGS